MVSLEENQISRTLFLIKSIKEKPLAERQQLDIPVAVFQRGRMGQTYKRKHFGPTIDMYGGKRNTV